MAPEQLLEPRHGSSVDARSGGADMDLADRVGEGHRQRPQIFEDDLGPLIIDVELAAGHHRLVAHDRGFAFLVGLGPRAFFDYALAILQMEGCIALAALGAVLELDGLDYAAEHDLAAVAARGQVGGRERTE